MCTIVSTGQSLSLEETVVTSYILGDALRVSTARLVPYLTHIDTLVRHDMP